MMTRTRKAPLVAFAVAAALTAPLAFAQSSTSAPPTEPQSTEQATPPTAGQTMNEASTASAPGKKSWADVDGDKDGKLTKAEAAAVPALAQVFDQADTDADGSLTSEEYKSFVGKSQGEDPAKVKK